jgi:hypothetical protein
VLGGGQAGLTGGNIIKGAALGALGGGLSGAGGWSGVTGVGSGTPYAQFVNAGGNALMGYGLGGRQGALSSLIGSAGGAGGGYLGQGTDFQSALRTLGSKGAQYLYGESQRRG